MQYDYKAPGSPPMQFPTLEPPGKAWKMLASVAESLSLSRARLENSKVIAPVGVGTKLSTASCDAPQSIAYYNQTTVRQKNDQKRRHFAELVQERVLGTIAMVPDGLDVLEGEKMTVKQAHKSHHRIASTSLPEFDLLHLALFC